MAQRDIALFEVRTKGKGKVKAGDKNSICEPGRVVVTGRVLVRPLAIVYDLFICILGYVREKMT
jgi:hypothetical protein